MGRTALFFSLKALLFCLAISHSMAMVAFKGEFQSCPSMTETTENLRLFFYELPDSDPNLPKTKTLQGLVHGAKPVNLSKEALGAVQTACKDLGILPALFPSQAPFHPVVKKEGPEKLSDLLLENGLNKKDKALPPNGTGYGSYVYPSGDSYVGYFVNYKRQGKGKYTWKDGVYHDGYWEADLAHGAGVRVTKTGRYEGVWTRGVLSGVVTILYPSGQKYEGESIKLMPWVSRVLRKGKPITLNYGMRLDFPVGFWEEEMRRNDPRPEKGQLIGLYLEDKTWGLGQIVNEPNWSEKFGFTIDCDVVGFKHVKVASLDDLDLQTISLEKKDIVFLITSDKYFTTNVNRVKRDKHGEYTLLLPFVRPILVDETETRRYEAVVIKGRLSPSKGSCLTSMLECYFGLGEWYPSFEDPERNFAVRFNPNIRPPNAKLYVPKPLFNPGEMPSLFCFFFDTKEGMLQAKPELESMGYRFFEKKKEGKKYMLLMSRFVKLTESCDEISEILGPVAEKWGGVYDGMFEV